MTSAIIVQPSKKVSTEKAKTAPIPARGYAPDKKAFARLVAAGAPKFIIYEADKGQTLGKFKMRPGEFLGVVDGYRTFGKGKREITKAVNLIHDDGATILDVETGYDSRTHGHLLFDAATKFRARSSADKKLLADDRADAYRAKHGMMSKSQAYKIWFTVGPSVEAKAEVTGWSRASLYNAFKKTGAPAGRPPKQTT